MDPILITTISKSEAQRITYIQKQIDWEDEDQLLGVCGWLYKYNNLRSAGAKLYKQTFIDFYESKTDGCECCYCGLGTGLEQYIICPDCLNILEHIDDYYKEKESEIAKKVDMPAESPKTESESISVEQEEAVIEKIATEQEEAVIEKVATEQEEVMFEDIPVEKEIIEEVPIEQDAEIHENPLESGEEEQEKASSDEENQDEEVFSDEELSIEEVEDIQVESEEEKQMQSESNEDEKRLEDSLIEQEETVPEEILNEQERIEEVPIEQEAEIHENPLESGEEEQEKASSDEENQDDEIGVDEDLSIEEVEDIQVESEEEKQMQSESKEDEAKLEDSLIEQEEGLIEEIPNEQEETLIEEISFESGEIAGEEDTDEVDEYKGSHNDVEDDKTDSASELICDPSEVDSLIRTKETSGTRNTRVGNRVNSQIVQVAEATKAVEEQIPNASTPFPNLIQAAMAGNPYETKSDDLKSNRDTEPIIAKENQSDTEPVQIVKEYYEIKLHFPKLNLWRKFKNCVARVWRKIPLKIKIIVPIISFIVLIVCALIGWGHRINLIVVGDVKSEAEFMEHIEKISIAYGQEFKLDEPGPVEENMDGYILNSRGEMLLAIHNESGDLIGVGLQLNGTTSDDQLRHMMFMTEIEMCLYENMTMDNAQKLLTQLIENKGELSYKDDKWYLMLQDNATVFMIMSDYSTKE